MRPHKYIRRTGSPGNYKYWYYDPKTRTERVAEDEKEVKGAREDHAARMIVYQLNRLGEVRTREIAEHTGLSSRRVQEIASLMAQRGRNRKMRGGHTGELSRDEAIKHGHDYHEKHIADAKYGGNVEHSDYAEHIRQLIEAHHSGEFERHSQEVKTRNRGLRQTARETGRVTTRRRQAAETPAPAPAPEAPAPAPETPAAEAPAPEATPRRRRRQAPAAPVSNMAEAPDSEWKQIDLPGYHGDAREFRVKNHQIVSRIVGDTGNGQPLTQGENMNLAPAALEQLRAVNEALGVVAVEDDLRAWGRAAERDRRKAAEQAARERLAREEAEQAEQARERAARAAREAEENAARERATAKERKARAKTLLDTLATEFGIDLRDEEAAPEAPAPEAPAPAPTPAPAPEAAPSTPESRELGEVDPAFSASEAGLRDQIAAQARGENPYLNKAIELSGRVMSALKPERQQAVKNMLNAFLKVRGVSEAGHNPWPTDMTEAQLKRAYNEIRAERGGPAFGAAKEHFERGVFHTVEEVMQNATLNPEVERMKRGYGAKQFARLQPYLSDAFKSANPSAPPPYPTWGDIKTWSQHGGTKPEWAGRTLTAVPKEVFDAAVKTPDGKPQYPPRWMPIHLMPVWNYIVKKAMKEGKNAYSGIGAAPTGNELTPSGDVNLPAQAAQHEGILKSALRKYVQMRGEGKLTDIPNMKLAEVDMTHADIFKSMDDFQRIITTKIIDPVALLKVVKEEMGKGTKKSFVLTLDVKERPFVSETALRKSLIDKIMRLKGKNGK